MNHHVSSVRPTIGVLLIAAMAVLAGCGPAPYSRTTTTEQSSTTTAPPAQTTTTTIQQQGPRQ